MSNAPRIQLNKLDELAAQLPRETRHAIILDLDAFEQEGVSRPGPLCDYAGKFYRAIHQVPSGFDASYLFRLGMSCHKLNSIDAMEAGMSVSKEDLLRDLAETKTKREQALEAMRGAGEHPGTTGELDEEVARIMGRDDLSEVAADRLAGLIQRAREICGIPTLSPAEELSQFEDEQEPTP